MITAALVCGVIGSASAQEAAPAAAPVPQLPSAAESLAAYETVEGWIREWSVPAERVLIDPPGTTAASITVRLNGKIVGRASHAATDGSAVWSAVRQFWNESANALPVENDAMRAERIAELAPQLMIDFALAGRMVPILGENEAAISAELSPGYEGVAARVGDRIEAVFPGIMLTTNTAPGDAVRIAAAKLDLPPRPIAELRAASGLILYRFPVRHLAQSSPLSQPEFLYRGGRIIGTTEVTGPAMRAAGERMVTHLLTHAWPGEEPHGITGDYDPIADRYSPLIAPPLEQAAVAFALARYARTPGIVPGEASRARRFALELVEKLAKITADESDPMGDARSAAMWLIAYAELGRSEESAATLGGIAPEFLADARGLVFRQFSIDPAQPGWAADSPTTGRGVIALAMVMNAQDEEETERSRAAVRALFRDTEPTGLVNEMPWLGWAELELVKDAETAIPAAEALQAMRELVWRFQVVESAGESGSADLMGGIVFNRSRNPLPTWHSLRAVAFLSTMLGDSRLTPADRVIPELTTLRPSIRFGFQLMVQEAQLHMVRDHQRALGGVRSAVWDQTLSLEATSMALLTVSEALASLDARAKRNAAGNP